MSIKKYVGMLHGITVFPIDKLSLSCYAPNQILTRGIWLQSDGVNIQENQVFNLMWGVDLFVRFLIITKLNFSGNSHPIGVSIQHSIKYILCKFPNKGKYN